MLQDLCFLDTKMFALYFMLLNYPILLRTWGLEDAQIIQHVYETTHTQNGDATPGVLSGHGCDTSLMGLCAEGLFYTHGWGSQTFKRWGLLEGS